MSLTYFTARFRVAAPLVVALVLSASLSPSALAMEGHGGDHGMEQGAGGPEDASSSAAYKAANAAMHREMDIAYSGDADIDFVRGMIPHHEGAVAMAKIALEHGTDPQIRKLAEEVVKAQMQEIAFMKAWLEQHGATVPASDTPVR
ncbi:MAG: DUF305 domain-containing protein [Xanthobacter sp.]